VLHKALYDNKVGDLVLDRILKDGMNVEQTLESLRREFLLDVSTSEIWTLSLFTTSFGGTKRRSPGVSSTDPSPSGRVWPKAGTSRAHTAR
jgi:hypothetical protein